uniref:Uncharacterized protein C13B9.2 n=1 Tax=Aceria tosichella TaxID=561515 RepID=A0A6G1SJ25_9ACAR
MHHIISSCKRDLLDIYKHAIEAVKPERLVKNCIVIGDGKFMVNDPLDSSLKPLEYDLNGRRLHVIGGGKCVLAMARGLAEIARTTRTTSLFSNGCLSVPIQASPLFESDRVTQDLMGCLDISVNFGSKDNLPDADSVKATHCILEKINEASRIDKNDKVRSLFVVLISGGGSACLTSPKHVSLEEKSDMIKRLVQHGADIVELNTVRRYFSHVKGGNLSRHIMKNNPDSQVISLIISDVINDPIEIIASGPTCLSLSEVDLYQSMIDVMTKYNLRVTNYPGGNHLSNNDNSHSVQNRIIGNNLLALNSLRSRADQLGYRTTLLGNDLSGSTNDILKHILNHDRAETDRSLIIGGGESTVLKGPGESWGVGGRVQEMALDYMSHKLSIESPWEVDSTIDMFMAGSTDGQDGPTDVAGCLASVSDWSLSKNFNLDDLIRAKKTHDSYNFWTKYRPDWLIKTGLSGTNVMDLYMLMNVRKTSTREC